MRAVHALAALLCSVLLPVAGPAGAEDSPEAVYAKLHAAAVAGDLTEMIVHATAARAAEVRKIPNGDEVARSLREMMPKTYTVKDVKIAPDGRHATLRATAIHGVLGPPQPMTGNVTFVKENGAWKIDLWQWATDPQAQRGEKAESKDK